MYLNIGQNQIIRKNTVTGIFDLDNSTVAKNTRDFLSRAQKEKNIIYKGSDLPVSFILCCENGEEKIYLSPLSSQTLVKRLNSPGI